MKKSILIGLAAMLVSTAAFAGFGLPKVNTGNSTVNSIANTGLDKGKNMAVAEVINNKLKKYSCSFKNDTTVDAMDTTCDLNKISSELSSWKSGLEQTIVNKVKVNVMASHKKKNSDARTRASNICNKIAERVNWWDCNESTGSGSNDFTVSVSVN